MKLVRSYRGGSLTPECHKANFEKVAHFARNSNIFNACEGLLEDSLEVAHFERNRWLSLERNMHFPHRNKKYCCWTFNLDSYYTSGQI